MPDYIIRQRDRGQADAKPRDRGRGQSFEAEAKILASRTLWPRGLNITANNPPVRHRRTVNTWNQT